MGLCNSPDVFQECMYKIFSDLEYIHVYIDDLLVTSCSTFKEHLQRLELVFSRLSKAGLKINTNKSHFAVSDIEYLGYWITRNGIQPVPKKIEAIQCIAPPTTQKQLQSIIGLINYYQDMWPRRSETLAPLTRLTSKDVPFQWTDVEQQAFDKMKAIVCHKVLLSYPDFNKPFHIHTDASQQSLPTWCNHQSR
jgi:putative transposase